MMIRPFTAALFTTLVAATSSLAEGRVSFIADAGDAGQMSMTERWSGSALRTDIEGMDAYMLLRDDSVYSIISMAGQITVIDLGQMKDMPGVAANQTPSQNEAGVVFPDEIVTIEEMGETREIAGVGGDVHEIEWVDNAGQPRTDNAVLTDDTRLLEHQALKMQLIETISGEAPNPLMVELQDRGLAALSFGDRFKVTEVNGDAGPAGDFDLPAEPMDLGNMMNMGNQ
jgi:hypothetical protein